MSENIRLIRRLFTEQPLRFTAVVLSLALASVLEGMGIAALGPMLTLVSGTGAAPDESAGTMTRLLTSTLDALHLPLNLTTALAFVGVLVLLQQIVTLVGQKITNGSIFLFEGRLRRDVYGAVLRADWRFFLRERTSDLVNALTLEVTRARQSYTALTLMLAALLSSVVYFALALLLSWQMTLVVVVTGLILLVSLRGRVARGAKFGKKITNLNSALQAEALESISSAKLVKGGAVEPGAVERFGDVTDQVAHQQYSSFMNQAWLRAIYDSGSAVAVLLGIFVAATYVGMPLPSLVVFLLVFYRLSPRLSNIQVLAHQVLEYVPSLDRLDEIHERADDAREETGGSLAGHLEREVRFEGVDFAYEPGKRILTDVSLAFPRGSMVAVVGPSGAGKTTVIDLLMRLIEPAAGGILLDGAPLADFDVESWRRRIGYVPQDGVLFHASIRENIRLLAPEANDDDIRRALDTAMATELVESLPEGLDTIVGDRGVRLSGGQRQRIALARALARRPDLLILDEATSALDTESERRIQEAIERLAGEVTIVVVTHRLSTVRNADYIYLLDGGTVAEKGRWDDLVSARGRFAELMHAQNLDEQPRGSGGAG